MAFVYNWPVQEKIVCRMTIRLCLKGVCVGLLLLFSHTDKAKYIF